MCNRVLTTLWDCFHFAFQNNKCKSVAQIFPVTFAEIKQQLTDLIHSVLLFRLYTAV